MEKVVEGLRGRDTVPPEEVRDLLLDAPVMPEELEPWEDFDHPVNDSYGRRLAYTRSGLEVLVVSWAPGDFSAIHDHGGTQWGAVQVFGPAEHATFSIDGGELSTRSRRRLRPREVLTVSHDLVHQMGNPSGERFTSLHIYGTAAHVPSVTANARVFDPQEQRILRVDGGVFFRLPACAIKEEEPGPLGDAPTILRDLGEQIRRLARIQAERGAHADALASAIRRWSAMLREVAAFARDQEVDAPGTLVLNEELKAAARLQADLDAL